MGNKLGFIVCAVICLLVWSISPVYGEADAGLNSVGKADGMVQPYPEDQRIDAAPTPGTNGELEMYRTRAGRGAYRSPPGSYSGARPGVNPGGEGIGTSPRTPAGTVSDRNRTGTAPGPGTGYAGTGRWGSFFGGLAAGAFFSHLLNPFGWLGGGYGGFGGYGGGFSIVGFLFWAVIFYMVYRVIRSFIGRGSRRNR